MKSSQFCELPWDVIEEGIAPLITVLVKVDPEAIASSLGNGGIEGAR